MAAADLATEILADSPKAYWKCQEDGTTGHQLPQDSSGNGLHMTTRQSTNFSYGAAGLPVLGDKMIVCAGGSGFERATLSTVTHDFTIEMVVQVQAVTVDPQALIYNGDGGANGWGLFVRTTGKLQPLLGGVAFLTITNTALTIGTTDWYHVVFVKRAAGTAPEIWINATKDTAVQATTAPAAPSGGRTFFNEDTACQGGYAHVAIYESALSSTRIGAHYTALTTPGTAIKTVMGVTYPGSVKTAIGLAQASVKTVDGLV